MSIGATVKRFANQRITVFRFEGFWDSGRYVKTETTFGIKANVQPARAADLQQLPENYRKQGAFWVRPAPSVELRTGSASTGEGDDGVVADELEIKGVRYLVVGVDDWRRHTGYLASRAQQ